MEWMDASTPILINTAILSLTLHRRGLMETTEKKTKVWIFHPDSSDESLGGNKRPARLAKHLNRSNYVVSVFSSSKFRYAKDNLIKDGALYLYREGKVPFYYIKSRSYKKNDINRILNWISFYFNVRKAAKEIIKKEGKPDLIIGSSPHPLAMLAAVRIGKKYKIPVINEVRDFWPEVIFLGGRVKETSLIGKIMLAGERYIYKKSNALIFLKEGDFQYIVDKKWDIKNGGSIDLDRCYYINNGVDLDEFEHNMRMHQLDDDDLQSDHFRAIYVGALGKVNDIDKILDAAKLLQKEDILFLIYGSGDQEDRLKDRLKDENIRNVKIKGYVESKYIPYVLSKASVNLLIYTQTQYNWSRGNSSNKLFEYMASGKPIISSVKMGYSIIDKYNCGIEIEDQRPEGLVEAIKHFYDMSDKELKSIEVNCKNGACDFDYSNLSSKLAQVIDKTITEYHR
jgi:glycosyltransferase involved in cell wall biosynthesis